VCTHDAGEKLHHEDLVVKREPLVIAIEKVVELFGECLRIVEELQGGKVGR
jgi:hypothetical protein